MMYMAVKNQSWGKGATIAEAKRKLREHTSYKGQPTIYQVPDDYRIDEYGRAHGSGPAVLISGPEQRNV